MGTANYNKLKRFFFVTFKISELMQYKESVSARNSFTGFRQ